MINSIKFVALILATVTLFLGIGQGISHAQGTAPVVYGAAELPACDSPAAVVIFDGAAFEGTIYLHDADVQLTTHQIKAIKALAANGQLPVVCQDAGTVIVTAQN